ncbi:GntR family transcriptional regulator [Paenirhodobacter sp.]|uniref:GntR family transcriptional regulator n=1 Tax=Paenirhodobacter sp. TaxID=1965326 RepID=UPI003B3DFE6C
MTRATDAPSMTPQLFETAAQVLRANIARGLLPEGLVLQESALSERLSMSRAPVKRALALLESEGLVSRFSGRGYLVGTGGGSPHRANLRELELDLDQLDEMAGQPNWYRLHDIIEQEILRTVVFGEYRIVESAMAQQYQVSRTVVREILGRLQERGLVSKSATSRWIVVPLTARKIRDKFELRMILEVAALRSANHDLRELGALREDMAQAEEADAIPPETWFALSDRFTEAAVLSVTNPDLSRFITINGKALAASQRALFALGLPTARQSLQELRLVIDLLLARAPVAAQGMFETHLANALHRTIAQLKIVAVMAPPTNLAPFLQPGET